MFVRASAHARNHVVDAHIHHVGHEEQLSMLFEGLLVFEGFH